MLDYPSCPDVVVTNAVTVNKHGNGCLEAVSASLPICLRSTREVVLLPCVLLNGFNKASITKHCFCHSPDGDRGLCRQQEVRFLLSQRRTPQQGVHKPRISDWLNLHRRCCLCVLPQELVSIKQKIAEFQEDLVYSSAAVLEPICVLQCWSLSAGMDSPCSSVVARPVSYYTILRHIVEQFLIE